MDNQRFYYDIFSTRANGELDYEGTIHYPMRGMDYNDMYVMAANYYPALPLRTGIRFVEQETQEWKDIMNIKTL